MNSDMDELRTSIHNADHDLMGRLEEVCRERGMKILRDSSIQDGGIYYYSDLSIAIIGDYVTALSLTAFEHLMAVEQGE